MTKGLYLKICFITLLLNLPGCKQPEPMEHAAVITGQDFTFCGSCGGWIVQVDSARYRADVEAPFNRNSKKVWIQFKNDESDGLKIQGRWIIISSIRNR